ncbi:MAG: hypothetical protein HQL22_02470 [Candidatus Omnitrophica bacterium]|nr:hypothetical protein [Candidatus Omnitrophota bacterium]
MRFLFNCFFWIALAVFCWAVYLHAPLGSRFIGTIFKISGMDKTEATVGNQRIHGREIREGAAQKAGQVLGRLESSRERALKQQADLRESIQDQNNADNIQEVQAPAAGVATLPSRLEDNSWQTLRDSPKLDRIRDTSVVDKVSADASSSAAAAADSVRRAHELQATASDRQKAIPVQKNNNEAIVARLDAMEEKTTEGQARFESQQERMKLQKERFDAQAAKSRD